MPIVFKDSAVCRICKRVVSIEVPLGVMSPRVLTQLMKPDGSHTGLGLCGQCLGPIVAAFDAALVKVRTERQPPKDEPRRW